MVRSWHDNIDRTDASGRSKDAGSLFDHLRVLGHSVPPMQPHRGQKNDGYADDDVANGRDENEEMNLVKGCHSNCRFLALIIFTGGLTRKDPPLTVCLHAG